VSKQGAGQSATPTARPRKPLDPLLLERLAETAFLASELRMHTQAERIFVCLATLRPGNLKPLIGLAMVRARRGQIDRAITELEDLLLRHPECELARAVLGTMLLNARRPGALPLFDTILTQGSDQDAITIARDHVQSARAQETAGSSAEAAELARYAGVRP
jgi:predicted Zn-dependent protease